MALHVMEEANRCLGCNGKRVAETMHAYLQSLPMPEPSAYANAPLADGVGGDALAEQQI